MTLILELGTDLERMLETRARRRGLALGDYIIELAQRDTAVDSDTQASANELWAQLTNDASHNSAILALAQAPEAVWAIVMERSRAAADRYYASAAGAREVEGLDDWRSLDDEPFLIDGAQETSAR